VRRHTQTIRIFIGIFKDIFFSLLAAYYGASSQTAIQKILRIYCACFYGLKVTTEIGENLKKTLDRSQCFWYTYGHRR
jgi:hypothetical protein